MSGFERPDPTRPPRHEPFPHWLFSLALASMALGFLLVTVAVKIATKFLNDNGVTP